MKLINATKKITIAEEVIHAKSLKEQTIGMLAFTKPKALLIKTRFGIHTFFMKYPIDVLVLDNNNQVVSLKENMEPNRMFFWSPKYETLLELPSGKIKDSKVSLYDTITFVMNIK